MQSWGDLFIKFINYGDTESVEYYRAFWFPVYFVAEKNRNKSCQNQS